MDPSRFFPSLPIHVAEIPFTILDSFVSKAEKTVRSLDTPSIPTLHFIRDDLLPFGFGTKWRKTQGILQYLQKNQIQKVLLWGAIHGNYLASFTTILRKNGFTVDTIAYTRDPHLRSYNERLVRGHSHTLVCYANRKLAYADWLAKEKVYPGLSLPEFGIHPGQNNGLHSFWQEIEKKIIQSLDTSHHQMNRQKIKAILRMEIGSGATFLSAFDYFYESSLLVQGVMVGETKETWIPKTKDLQKQLGLKNIPIPTEQILEIPKEGKNSKAHLQFDNNRNKTSLSFGKQTKSQKEWIREFYRNTNILLEPIYSGMTVKPLLRELNEMQITMSKPLPNPSGSLSNPPSSLSSGKNPISSIQPTPIFYLHQGGQIQHLDLILEKDHQ